MSEHDTGDLPLGDEGDDWAGGVDVPSSRWPAVLAELVDILIADWERLGVDRETALKHAQREVILIANYRGGRPFYLPRGDRLKKALRDREIYLRHTGRNTEPLADEYGTTVRHIQRISAEQHALHVKRAQADLFPPPS